jgi:hypothetical protein
VKTSSAKAKGRRLQDWVVERVRTALDLHEDDIRPALMGESGEDIKLSAEGRRRFPYSVECKNQEALSIWAAIRQAKANAGDRDWLLFFTRNREDKYVVLSAEHFIGLLGEIDTLYQDAF